jgi:hypothetical protein
LLNKYEFLKVYTQTPWIFNVLFWKLIIISNHNQKFSFYILKSYCNISYNFYIYTMYIIPHSYVVKNLKNLKILKWFEKLFELSECYNFIFKNYECFFNVTIRSLSSFFFNQKFKIIWILLIILCKIVSL